MPALTLQLIEDAYAVCRLPAGAEAPAPVRGRFSMSIRAVEETTIVCPLDLAPHDAEVDPGWRCFRILQVFDFSVPGILASVLSPLAQAGIGIFASSTFSTDYVLVKASDLRRATDALTAAGHQVTT
ncbi:MAG TPA: ACT domain-containing protein [Microvirga sp.]|nr:ACT domain-containing protein [Microvirga sp.]